MGSDRLATIPDLFGKTGAIFFRQAFLDTLTICRERRKEGKEGGCTLYYLESRRLIKRVHYLSLLPTRLPANEPLIRD